MIAIDCAVRRRCYKKPFASLAPFAVNLHFAMLKKILIANRGAIACRIIRTLKRMGIRSVAVYSEADRHSLHVSQADEAICIGPPAAAASYLDHGRILQVAQETGAGAIHPGYGFLSENVEFASRCRDEGIIFVGPTPEAMSMLGDKVQAKANAIAAGIPVIEDSRESLDNVEIARSEAARIGYPVMLKATAGGGGRGMRVIRNEDELQTAYSDARSEAAKAFGKKMNKLSIQYRREVAANISKTKLDPDLCAKVRASILFAGPMLARTGAAEGVAKRNGAAVYIDLGIHIVEQAQVFQHRQ